MKKVLLIFGSIILSVNVVFAQDKNLPKIPAITYDIKDFGAIADGKTINTEAIQMALDKAKVTGGKVLVPPGTYLCGPLKMYSKTELYLSRNAVLRLPDNIEVFPVQNERYLNFVDVANATDVKIDGEGMLDGQGEIWWRHVEGKDLKYRRPQMVYIQGAERIEIAGIKFLNPPNTHLSLKNTNNVYIHNITIDAPAKSHNTDGINISAKNCTIENCKISTGDDNIAINFGNKPSGIPECENIVIRNCDFGYGHGLSIGSFTSGGLRNLVVSNCTFDGTTSAVRIKTARGRGGLVENITYADITIRNSKWPIFISEYYPKEPTEPQNDPAQAIGEKTPVYKNITLKNVSAINCEYALLIWGIPESPVQNLNFDHITLSGKNGARIFNANHVQFSNSSIINKQGQMLQTYKAEVKGLK